MNEQFFHELNEVHSSNGLYQEWIDYALTLTRDDVLRIAKSGLTHQANGLKSMLREIIAGVDVPTSLLKKIDAVVKATSKRANELRS